MQKGNRAQNAYNLAWHMVLPEKRKKMHDYNYNWPKNMLRFPQSNGHFAWHLHTLTIAEAVKEDLFWRKMQTSPELVENIVKAMWPDARRENKEMIISRDRSVSLAPESGGAYSSNRGNSRLRTLSGNDKDVRHIEDALNYPASCGYYLGPLLQYEKGWLPHTVVENVCHHVDMKLTPKARYLFDQKACHRQILMSLRDRDEAEKSSMGFFPVQYGFKPSTPYWYTAENTSTCFGVVYFHHTTTGESIKLPLTAWESMAGNRGDVVYDALHPHSPYPLYDLAELVQHRGKANFVLICQSEFTVEYFKEKYRWIADLMPITTYSNIEGTGWGVLQPRTPIIFPESSANGCKEAFQLSEALKQHGIASPLFVARQAAGAVGSMQFHQDIGRIAHSRGECTLPEFAEHCEREFGVKPPQGILPQAVSLLSLPESTSKLEPLLEGLLDQGELMMLFAWRGVGKSLFALFLAICFANAKTAFGGRVCPSRRYRTLLVDAEMSPGSLKKRALALCRSIGLPESAADELMVRSARSERKELNLDTEAGWKNLEPDMMQAEVIIVDSLFKLFPSAMTAEFSGTAALQNFFDWCRKHNKTLIIIDHEGKKGGTSFGSMGKEIGLDAIIQLSRIKGATHVKITKSRNHASHSGCWLQYSIATSDAGSSIRIEALESLHNNEPAKALPVGESAQSVASLEEPQSSGLDETIIEYIKVNPDMPQGKITTALEGTTGKKRSTIQSHIKALREAGKLPFWQNPPKTSTAEEYTSASA